MPDDQKTERFSVLLSKPQIASIEDWRFANRVGTRAEAFRRLVDMGLEADRRLCSAEQATAGTGTNQ